MLDTWLTAPATRMIKKAKSASPWGIGHDEPQHHFDRPVLWAA